MLIVIISAFCGWLVTGGIVQHSAVDDSDASPVSQHGLFRCSLAKDGEERLNLLLTNFAR